MWLLSQVCGSAGSLNEQWLNLNQDLTLNVNYFSDACIPMDWAARLNLMPLEHNSSRENATTAFAPHLGN